MNILNNQIERFQLVELSQNELIQVTGGNWFLDAVWWVGAAVGTAAHAAIDAFLFLTGNDPNTWYH